MEAQRIRRRYDHRLQQLVPETGDIKLAVTHGVPRSTARDSSRLSFPEVVSLDVVSTSEHELRVEVGKLRKRNGVLVQGVPRAGLRRTAVNSQWLLAAAAAARRPDTRFAVCDERNE